jgi:hypothetical protein
MASWLLEVYLSCNVISRQMKGKPVKLLAPHPEIFERS